MGVGYGSNPGKVVIGYFVIWQFGAGRAFALEAQRTWPSMNAWPSTNLGKFCLLLVFLINTMRSIPGDLTNLVVAPFSKEASPARPWSLALSQAGSADSRGSPRFVNAQRTQVRNDDPAGSDSTCTLTLINDLLTDRRLRLTPAKLAASSAGWQRPAYFWRFPHWLRSIWIPRSWGTRPWPTVCWDFT